LFVVYFLSGLPPHGIQDLEFIIARHICVGAKMLEASCAVTYDT
jgi:hypothetical protein